MSSIFRASRALPALAFVSALVLSACALAPASSDLSNVNGGIANTARQEQVSAQAVPQPVTITIHADSFHMDPSAVTIPAGRPITLVYYNDDTVIHRLMIPQMTAKVLNAQDIAALAKAPTTDTLDNLIKQTPDGEVSFAVDPGKSITASFVATQTGTYDLQCILPGHSNAGMDAKVFVTGVSTVASQSATAATQSTATTSTTAATPTDQSMPGMDSTSSQSAGGHVMAPPTAAGQAHQAYDASLPAVESGTVKDVTFNVTDTNVEIAPGITMAAWTFGGTIPGPVVHVRQGDTVKFTLNNHSTMAHSIDFHAARTAPNVNYKNVLPGQSYSFTWVAKDPGVFMYHCGTAPILQHLAQGMYGAVVVDPVDNPLPKVDREFVFVQSEFYLTQPQNGVVSADFQKAQTGQADYVVFNGYANQYSDHPIVVKTGEKIRVYLVNAGPNHFSATHVVGTIFDHVWVDGNPQNDLKGMQTWTVAPGEGSAFDFTLSEPGNYPMVTHSFMDANKGAVAVFKAE